MNDWDGTISIFIIYNIEDKTEVRPVYNLNL